MWEAWFLHSLLNLSYFSHRILKLIVSALFMGLFYFFTCWEKCSVESGSAMGSSEAHACETAWTAFKTVIFSWNIIKCLSCLGRVLRVTTAV